MYKIGATMGSMSVLLQVLAFFCIIHREYLKLRDCEQEGFSAFNKASKSLAALNPVASVGDTSAKPDSDQLNQLEVKNSASPDASTF